MCISVRAASTASAPVAARCFSAAAAALQPEERGFLGARGHQSASAEPSADAHAAAGERRCVRGVRGYSSSRLPQLSRPRCAASLQG